MITMTPRQREIWAFSTAAALKKTAHQKRHDHVPHLRECGIHEPSRFTGHAVVKEDLPEDTFVIGFGTVSP